MGSSSSKPSYSFFGFVFGQALGASAYTSSVTFPPVTADLRGKQYVVTGGSSGIGQAVASALFLQGATVHILCRNITRGREAKSAIEKQGSSEGTLQVHAVDCGKPEEVRNFAEEVFSNGAKCDGLVNNAGALLTKRTLVDGLESHVACHVIGLHAMIKFLRPALERASKDSAGRTHVINVASAGLYTAKLDLPALQDGFQEVEEPDGRYDGALVYAVCKRAMMELTQCWAQELTQSNVTVSCMHPGWTKTDGLDGLFELYPSYKSWYDSFRAPEEGADTIIWLSSQDSIESGKFWFDREVASEHQWFAGTSSTPDEQEELWRWCEAVVEARTSGGAANAKKTWRIPPSLTPLLIRCTCCQP